MQNSKFFTLARTLKAKEFSDFNKYLKRLHRKDDIALVFDYLRKFYPSFQDDKLDIGYAYHQIFKKPIESSDTNRVKMLNIFSDLSLALRDFLWLEKAKSDSLESQAFWVAILKDRGLMTVLSKKAALLQRDLEALPKTSVADYMKGMMANYFYYYHLITDKQAPDIVALKNCGTDMDLFYTVCRLKIACEMANRKNLLSLDFSLTILPNIIELINNHAAVEHPLLALYFRVYELIAEQQDGRYTEIEALLREHVRKIDPEELQTILSYLHNYAAAKIRQGGENFLQMTHRINKFGVEHGVFIGSGEISSAQFNNIVNAACAVKDFTWAMEFINSHQIYLLETARKDAVLLAEALIHFEKKEYRMALEKLKEADSTDTLYAIRSRSLMMKIYYEDKNMDIDVENYCVAFEGFLKRRKTPKEAVEAALNTIKIVKTLYKKNSTQSSIFKDIETTKPLYFKVWLIAKTKEYKRLF